MFARTYFFPVMCQSLSLYNYLRSRFVVFAHQFDKLQSTNLTNLLLLKHQCWKWSTGTFINLTTLQILQTLVNLASTNLLYPQMTKYRIRTHPSNLHGKQLSSVQLMSPLSMHVHRLQPSPFGKDDPDLYFWPCTTQSERTNIVYRKMKNNMIIVNYINLFKNRK